MSAPIARRFSVFAFECACGARSTIPRATIQGHNRQLQRSFASSARTYYADKSEVKRKPGRPRKVRDEAIVKPEDGSEVSKTPVPISQPEDGPQPPTVTDEPPISAAKSGQWRSSTIALEEIGSEIPEGAVLVSEEEETSQERLLESTDLDAGDSIEASAEAEIAPQQETVEGIQEDAALDVAPGADSRSESFWTYTSAGQNDQKYLKENVTPLGHDELEQQREYREYARLAAWELPLLSKLAKPFRPPTKQQPLRFRYTTYLGEEHPAASKVVLEFSPSDLPDLSGVQRDKLIKLLGVRYNPSTDTAKMSHESHTTQAQNKRYLLDRLNDLLEEVRHGKDTFEDVPFDFRHHKPKTRHEFPKSWIMTEQRARDLLEKRTVANSLEAEREVKGGMIDGRRIVQHALEQPAMQEEKVIVNRATGRPLRSTRWT